MKVFFQSSLIFSLLLFISSGVHALGNHNLRVDRFKWMRVQTEHFDIHYDKKSEALVPRMAHYLEKAWVEVGQKLNFEVPKRTPFFFFSNHNKFEQTNVVSIGEGTGGVTEAFKNRFLIFNNGSETWMKHVIYHEFAHVVQFNVLYGGFWKSVRLLKSPFYPLWVMEGMAEYATEPVDAPLTDMMVRDAVYHKSVIPISELQGFNHLKPDQVTQAYKTGTAAMLFLADEYGPDKVGELLKTLESYFDVSSALGELLGSDVERFNFRFREWLDDRYADFFAEAKEPVFYGPQLTLSDELPQFNHAPVVSKEGDRLFFFSDQNGPTQLYQYDLDTQVSEPLLDMQWKDFENIHTRGRALSLSKDGRWLVFAGEKKQRDFLYFYDLKKQKLKKVKIPFDQIRSPVFSPVEDHLVCVGMDRGYNDLYLISRQGKILKRLTDNPQDETNPVFSSDGKQVVYSGEVLNASASDPAGRDLFSVALEDLTLRHLTDFEGDETEPEVLPDGSLVFVRTQNDAGQLGFNLTHVPVSMSRAVALTHMVGGAFSPRYDASTNSLFYIGYNAGERHIYRYENTGFLNGAPVAAAPSDSEDFWGDPPRKALSPGALTRAMQAWPDGADTSLLLQTSKAYRLRLSTDLFLPFFFYSSLEGLVAANIWQFSDTLGNHQIQQQMQYASGRDFLDLALFYTYARFRPQFTFGFRTERFFRDVNEQQQRREFDSIGLASYPLDRINSVNVGVGASDQDDLFLDGSREDIRSKNRFWLAGFSHDTVTGRYLVPTQGRRFSLFYQEGLKEFGGNQQFRSGGAEAVQYVKLPRESTFASRLFYGRSVGSQPQVFRLGGVDRIRAVTRSGLANKKFNAVYGSGELRLRMKYLHARTKFLFPDFFFKAAYLILFNDIGYGWDNRREREAFKPRKAINSAGVGISWPTFVMQTFQMNLTVQWARRTDNGSEVWYITLGPSF